MSVVGTGAFATVWLGRDPELDCDVAVKLLADNWSQRADVRERFMSEARMLRRVESERVVRIYDVGTLPESEGARPFIVMAYAEGGSLAGRLAEGELGAERARAVLAQVAEGLAALHRKGIVHRDLNPNNLLLRDATPDSDVLIADLGLAKDLAAASGLTQPLGTGDYRAPEQLVYSDEVAAPADVFAFGRLARGLLPPHVLAEPAVADALARAAAPRPQDRPTLGELAAAVTGVAADETLGPRLAGAQGVSPDDSGDASVPAAPRRRGPVRRLTVAAFALAVAALAVVTLWQTLGSRMPDAAAPSGSSVIPASASPQVSPASTTPSGTPVFRTTRATPSCTGGQLGVSARTGPIRSGTVQITLVLTNTSTQTCTVTGWPGVSLVTNDTGDQVGQPAVRFGPAGTGVVLAPQGTASASVQVAPADAQPACARTPARGLRVYLPDTTTAAFVKIDGLVGCADPNTPSLLTVSVLR
ncbi:MAG: protein kinase [Dermatophilaceae bacterium]